MIPHNSPYNMPLAFEHQKATCVTSVGPSGLFLFLAARTSAIVTLYLPCTRVYTLGVKVMKDSAQYIMLLGLKVLFPIGLYIL